MPRKHTCPICGHEFDEGGEPCVHQFHLSPSFHPEPLQGPSGVAYALRMQYERSEAIDKLGEYIKYPSTTRIRMKAAPKEKKRSRYDIALEKGD